MPSPMLSRVSTEPTTSAIWSMLAMNIITEQAIIRLMAENAIWRYEFTP